MTIPFTEDELESLMDRPICRLLTAADRKAFAGRRVLITGAGGSIGSELSRQIARCTPARLILVDSSELNLFQVERELQQAAPHVPVDVVLGDVSRRVVANAIRVSRPDVIYHAAAYKHVTMVERAVCASVEANVLGTAMVAEAAREVGARFVLISSDKAAAPESVMGATKRLAELVALSRATAAFRPVVVRFGNVLGSSGSVLTIMRDAIRRGQPIPVTDPQASRYFMTVGEAASLVIKAGLLSDRAETYWLDMGRPVTIGELAARMMAIEKAAGHRPVPLQVIGLRPGEKLREELTTQGLRMCRTSHKRIWVATQPAASFTVVARAERRLRARTARGDSAGALAWLAAAVPEFRVSPEASAMAQAQRVAADTTSASRMRVA
ncbi:MAG: polysaccharide biosynthesis protein [Vicinamibacterales bacterium]